MKTRVPNFWHPASGLTIDILKLFNSIVISDTFFYVLKDSGQDEIGQYSKFSKIFLSSSWEYGALIRLQEM